MFSLFIFYLSAVFFLRGCPSIKNKKFSLLGLLLFHLLELEIISLLMDASLSLSLMIDHMRM